MKSATGLIAAAIILMLMGGIMAGLSSFRGVDVVEPHNVDSGSASADIILSNELLDDHTYNCTIVSNQATDAAVPFSYTSATKTLTVTGLDDAVSHTLTLTYKTLQLDSAADVGARIFPVLLILGVIALVAGAIYNAWRPDHS